MAKHLFLSAVDLVCLKLTARTDRLSALRNSKATMLSEGSCNADEWTGEEGRMERRQEEEEGVFKEEATGRGVPEDEGGSKKE